MLWTGVTLFPTFVCNFSCPFCAFSADLNQHRDELTLAEIEQLARELGRVLVLHIGGGEPFIRKDLPEVIHTMWLHAGVRKVEIPTNGWSAERIREPVARILDLCPGLRLNVRVSLDGVGELHDRVRARPGSYKAAVETLAALRQMSADHPLLSTGVCQTITAHNQESALTTYQTIRDDLKPDALVVNVCRDGSQEDRVSLDVVPARYQEVIRNMNEDVERGRWWNYPRSRLLRAAFLNGLHATVWELISQELSTGRPAIQCAAGKRRTLIVYSTGDVAFCELAPVVGNLRRHGGSLAGLLATGEARKGQEALRSCDKRHEICWHTAAPDPRLNLRISLRVLARAGRLAMARVFGGRERPAAT
jgi:MoaA/NifB/PqqE/SkfB family radical SAM enzyme